MSPSLQGGRMPHSSQPIRLLDFTVLCDIAKCLLYFVYTNVSLRWAFLQCNIGCSSSFRALTVIHLRHSLPSCKCLSVLLNYMRTLNGTGAISLLGHVWYDLSCLFFYQREAICVPSSYFVSYNMRTAPHIEYATVTSLSNKGI